MIHAWKCAVCRTRPAEHLVAGTSYCPECLNGEPIETNEPEPEKAKPTLWQRIRGNTQQT